MEVKQKQYLKVPNGHNAKSMETAMKVAEKLNIDLSKVKIEQDEEGFYFEEIVIPEDENSKKSLSLPNQEITDKIIDKAKSITSVEDARKLLEDSGIPMATKEEVAEFQEQQKQEQQKSSQTMDQLAQLVVNLAQSTQAMLEAQQQTSKEDSIRQQLKEEQAEKKAGKKQAEDGLKSHNKIMNEVKIEMTIVRRRNAHGQSTEKKRTAYAPDGSLLRDSQGASYNTEVAEICFNDYIYSFDIGPDLYGNSEGMVKIYDVPWSIAKALAERRYPQTLRNPETEEVFEPFCKTNRLVTPSNQLIDGKILRSGLVYAKPKIQSKL